MQKLVFLFALLIPTFFFIQVETAEARTTCRSIGKVWSSAQKRCVGGSSRKQPRYRGRGNKYCQATPPSRQNMAGFRVSNQRAPHVQTPVYRYLTELKNHCKSLVVESTFRSCDANRNARGVQRSKHLCGAAADVSGCHGRRDKKIAASICRQSGLVFVDEGPRRFPHCQMETDCN